MSWGHIFAAIMFGGFGIVMICFGLDSVIKMRRFIAAATRTAGTVVAHEARISKSRDDDDRVIETTIYYPVIEFKDAKGIQRRVTSTTGTNPKAFADGAAVVVLFGRDNPERAEIESFRDLWLLPTILLGGGALFLSIGIAVGVASVTVKGSF